MAESTHSIRAQRLEIEAASEALAFALQPRLGDLNRQHLLPVIERVLGEVDVPGRYIRLDRIAVDLGSLPLAGLEAAAEAALYDTLYRSLREAIDSQAFASDAAPAGADAEEIDLLAEYLRRGTLPFWASSAGVPRDEFSAPALVNALAVSAPAALAAMIRRVGRERYGLERLVLVLDEATLQTVLRLIEPAYAALILGYMLDLRHIHRVEPQLSIGETAYARLLWTLTFNYLLRDAGSYFNRKSYVASLLRGMAQSGGLDFRTLLGALERGLRETLRHLPLTSSLPAVIADIAAEFESDTAAADAADASAGFEAETPAKEPAAWATLVRRHGGDRRKLTEIVASLDEATLLEILRLLEPVHVALIVAYLLDLRQVHHSDPVLPLGELDFAELLWVLTFSYLRRDAGSQFNRKSFVRALLQDLARSEGLDYAALIATLARGVRQTTRHRPLASSLPAMIDEIVRDVDDGSEVASDDMADRAREAIGDDPEQLAAFIRRHAGDRQSLDRLVARLDDAALEAVLRQFEPVHSALVLSYLTDLRRVRVAAGLLRQDETAFRALLWSIAFGYFAPSASQFDRNDFVRAVVTALAESENVDLGALLPALAEGLRISADRAAAPSSLPAIIGELAGATPSASAIAEAPDRVFERYARRDALIFYMRYGVLPADVLVHHPGWSVEALSVELADLGLAPLRAIFSAFTLDEQLRALLRAVRVLPPDVLTLWLRRLLPPAAESPLADAVDAAAAGSERRDVFYTRLIAVLLDGGELDLEVMSKTDALSFPEDTSEWPDLVMWPAPQLHAALLATMRGSDVSMAKPQSTELFDALLTRAPADAKSFLHNVVNAPDRDVLLAAIPLPHFKRMIRLARPAEAQALEFLLEAIAALPMSERSGSEMNLRRAILGEALRAGAAADDMRGAIARILRSTFAAPVPAPVAKRLLEAVQDSALAEPVRWALVEALSATGTPAAPDGERPLIAMRDALFDWLRGAEPAISLDLLIGTLREMLERFAPEVRAFLSRHAGDPALRERWSRGLPEAALARLVHVLEPDRFRAFIDAAELLHEAGVAVAAGQRPLPPRAALWQILLDYLAATPPALRSTSGLTAHFIAQFPSDEAALRRTATGLARASGRQSLAEALARDRGPVTSAHPQPARKTARPKSVRAKTAFGMDDTDIPEGEAIYIGNAGLILAGVFLPHLFRSLEFLTEDAAGRTKMRDHDTASRAVHLLQYLVDGRCNAPEPLLVLNKIMCGMPVEAPILPAITPSERELALCDSLLHALISRWEIIQTSSVAALRETFLRREGRLTRKTDAWELRVARKTVDVLVDRVPWNAALIYNSWMQQPLHVTW